MGYKTPLFDPQSTLISCSYKPWNSHVITTGSPVSFHINGEALVVEICGCPRAGVTEPVGNG